LRLYGYILRWLRFTHTHDLGWLRGYPAFTFDSPYGPLHTTHGWIAVAGCSSPHWIYTVAFTFTPFTLPVAVAGYCYRLPVWLRPGWLVGFGCRGYTLVPLGWLDYYPLIYSCPMDSAWCPLVYTPHTRTWVLCVRLLLLHTPTLVTHAYPSFSPPLPTYLGCPLVWLPLHSPTVYTYGSHTPWIRSHTHTHTHTPHTHTHTFTHTHTHTGLQVYTHITHGYTVVGWVYTHTHTVGWLHTHITTLHTLRLGYVVCSLDTHAHTLWLPARYTAHTHTHTPFVHTHTFLCPFIYIPVSWLVTPHAPHGWLPLVTYTLVTHIQGDPTFLVI